MLEKLPVYLEEDEIQKRIKEVAEQIDKDYVGEDVVVISILKGAIFFTVDLVKKMKTPIELEVMQVSSYVGTESSGNLLVKKDLDRDISGRNVLIVEDIIDTGTTLSYLKEYLLSKNPKTLRIAVLADKAERRKVPVKLDYTCFVIPDKFVVGYGLDVDELYRNLPYIGYIDV